MGRTPQGQCPNCDVPHPGICPCAWCDQLGHIAQDCIAHFADSSMQARFPKREKVPRTPLKQYECHRCWGTHPFNIFCPTIRDPPVIPESVGLVGLPLRNMPMTVNMWLSKIILGYVPIVGDRTIDMLHVHNER